MERVTLPTAPSVLSGDLVPDVSLTSDDVRVDVTTKSGTNKLKKKIEMVIQRGLESRVVGFKVQKQKVRSSA